MPVKMHFCYGEIYGKMETIVGFEVLMAVAMKSSVFLDITVCTPLKIN
jgi:hypothetical protein